MTGDQEQTAPYAGVKFIFENAVGSDRYQEPALDNPRTNDVNQHFLAPFPSMHLMGDDYQSYLDVKQGDSNAANDYGNPGYPAVIWKGFPEWSAGGLELHHLRP